jgi:two-component system response regulator DevR
VIPVRVLVVDDSPAIRTRLVALMGEIDGVDTSQASGADEALEHVQREGTDLVILDIHMPGISGLEILPRLKATPARPIVVVLTSHPTELHRRQCLALGADYFFDKSRDFAQVVDVVVRPTLAARPSDP